MSVVVLSDGTRVQGSALEKLERQRKILLKLCDLHKNDAKLQKMIGDANLLGMDVADLLKELEDEKEVDWWVR